MKTVDRNFKFSERQGFSDIIRKMKMITVCH